MTEMIAPRDAFGKAITQMGCENPNIIVLDADLAPSTKTSDFAAGCPNQFFQVGIAEQNMVGMAAGLSTMGFIPFTSTFACFATDRVLDQIRIVVAQPRLNVKLVGAYIGLLAGKTGKTHQTVDDIAVLRAMPNMVIVSPVDAVEMRAALKTIVEYDGPVYLRVSSDPAPVIMPDDYKFVIGKSVVLCEGKDVTIISTSMMTVHALQASQTLAAEGISAHVVHVPTLKPIDVEGIVAAAERTGLVVTAEDHNVIGGLGGAVAEVLSEHRPTLMKRVGIKDTFAETAGNTELLTKYGLMPADIVAAAKDLLARRK
jgi:transketolase